MVALLHHGPKAVAVIDKGLRGNSEEMVRLRKLIKKLDDDDFKVRRATRDELEKQGLRALPVLQEALKEKLSLDMEEQVRAIIQDLEIRGLSLPETGLHGERLRAARSILILEKIGGKDALKTVEFIASLKHDKRIVEDAKSAVEQWRR